MTVKRTVANCLKKLGMEEKVRDIFYGLTGRWLPKKVIPENAFGWDYDTISASLCSCYANKKEAQKSEARNEP